MRTSGLLALLFLSSAAVYGQEGFRQNCWDGTFAYNTLNVEQVSDGFEVSLSGSQLKMVSDDDSFNWNPQDIYVKFPTDACQIESQNLKCRMDHRRGGWANVYFLAHRGPDVGYQRVPAQMITFSSGEQTELKIITTAEDSVEDRYGFTAWECNNDGRSRTGGTHWGRAEFSEELRELIRDQISDPR